MSVKGIDVSVWQGNIDFNRVKSAGIDFVIIRAGYGNGNKDKCFEENYRGAKSAGLHCAWSNRYNEVPIDLKYQPDYQWPNLSGLLEIL